MSYRILGNTQLGKGLRFLLISLLIASPVLATKNFQPVFKPTLDVFRTNGQIEIDGKLVDPGWSSAGRVENFVERNPGENTPPEAETRAFVTFDEDKLYVAYLCLDNVSDLRATMCQRDQFYGDDAICLLIDTYTDATRAYEFFVNPYGVQKDALWSAVGGEDFSFDMIWESAAQITDSGYQVEIAIPFSSLRFPSRDIQSWKMDFWRNRPRESFKQYSWAAYDRNEQCWPCQWGTVSGISDAKPGKGVEFLPAVVANQTGIKSDFRDPDSHFDNQDPDAELSLGGKYAINSDITLEATYNPDFSQIEADAAQIDINSTIALFYPERRPFFQEGSDIFRTLFNSFFTRTVNDPKFAAKVAGRTARRSFALLVAEDENSPYIIPLDQSSLTVNSGKSLVGVFRGAQAFGQNSTVGVMLSQRNFEDDGSASVGALDFDIRLTRNYRVDGQYIATYTGEPIPIFKILNGDFTLLNNLFHVQAFRTSLVWFVLFAVIFSFILMRTRYGNWVFAAGGAPEAARAQGVNVNFVKIFNFALVGFLVSIASILQFAHRLSVDPLRGDGMELIVVAASVIGGTRMTGGYGTIVGAVLGTFLLQMLDQGLVLMSIPIQVFQACVGLIILISVISNTYLGKTNE